MTKQVRAAFVIARFVLHESLHNNILIFAAALFAATFAAGYLLTGLMIASRLKVLLDFTLLSYQLFVFCLILFFVAPFFNRPEQRKTISLFLTKQISRSTLMIGIFLGFTILLFLVGVVLFGTSLVLFRFLSGIWMLYLGVAFLTIFVEGIFLLSAGLFFALILPTILAAGAVVALYILGYTSHDWFALISKGASPFVTLIASIGSYLVPDLSVLDVKSRIIYQVPINSHALLLAFIYTLSTTGIFLVGSLLLFRNKRI